MNKYDIQPHDYTMQTVYRKGLIMFLPLYSGKGYVGPGFPRHDKKIYQDYDLTKMGAVRDLYRLWTR